MPNSKAVHTMCILGRFRYTFSDVQTVRDVDVGYIFTIYLSHI